MDTSTSFISITTLFDWIIILFDEAFKYGDGGKL
jgi:hypothetical protein